MTASPIPSLVDAPQREAPETHHFTCCDSDGRLGLCGTDTSLMPETDGTGEEPCFVCYDIGFRRFIRCPLTGEDCEAEGEA